MLQKDALDDVSDATRASEMEIYYADIPDATVEEAAGHTNLRAAVSFLRVEISHACSQHFCHPVETIS